MPTSRRAICSGTGCAQTPSAIFSVSWPQHSDGPNGMIAETMRAGAIAMTGAHMNRNLCALPGT